MPQDKFLIAPINSGLQTNLKPWLIADDAYESLENAYVFRGRVRKRFGSDLSADTVLGSRLKVPIINDQVTLAGGAGVGITDGLGDATGTVPGTLFSVGQKFSIGTEIFEVVTVGTPSVMTTNGGATTKTFNTTNGAYVFAGATPNTQIYFYPSGSGGGITSGAGNAAGIVPGDNFKLGQLLSVDTKQYTVKDDTPGLQDMHSTDGASTGSLSK